MSKCEKSYRCISIERSDFNTFQGPSSFGKKIFVREKISNPLGIVVEEIPGDFVVLGIFIFHLPATFLV